MNSYLPKSIIICLLMLISGTLAWSQNIDTVKLEIKSDELLDLLVDTTNTKKEFVYSTFKSSRIVDNQSIENTAKGTLDFRISHRFNPVSGGIHDLFGIDGSSIRLGFDYGLNNAITVGVGRSSLFKEYDGFLKAKVLRQTSKNEHPISISYVGGISVTSLPSNQLLGRPLLTSESYPFSNRLFYFNQILLARKFNNNFSLQIMPTHIHYNFVNTKKEPNDLFALGVGTSIKLTSRTHLNFEYIYQFSKLNGTVNSLSTSFDIETGGHVFQLIFSNSLGMTERTFVGQTTDKWQDMGFRFGFNISRVFTIVRPNNFENSRNKIW
ncbi:MAG TPA: DUF5777 family beta-barrel protein [Edaphocola sp.]|nr:DUF5777 family beta-barrel protein [Edaphocola sp.]